MPTLRSSIASASSDLTRVGDNSVTRQPHIFLAAGRSRCGQKQLQGGVDGRKRRSAVPRDPFDDARAGLRRAHGCLVVCDVGQFLARAARPQNEFRLIRLDETRQHVFGSDGSISAVAWPAAAAARRPMIVSELTPQSRKTRRFCSEAIALARSRLAVAKLFARQPAVAAIVIDRRRRLEARDQRKKSAAGEVQVVHCNCGRDRLIGAFSTRLIQ